MEKKYPELREKEGTFPESPTAILSAFLIYNNTGGFFGAYNDK